MCVAKLPKPTGDVAGDLLHADPAQAGAGGRAECAPVQQDCAQAPATAFVATFMTIGVVPLAQQYHSNVTVLSRYIVTLGRDT